MISKQEILDTASKLGLGPQVVEKDYALGWVLAGIANHTEIGENWIFKGGTCLKKCYFETYRFSEDLDFTLRDGGQLDEEFLKKAFGEISEWVYEQSGLELPTKFQNFEIYKNPRGQTSCLGKLSYRGPVSPSSNNLPRIKLDLTADERLVLPPAKVAIFHPYRDGPEDGIVVNAYAYEETFGEKVRALAERTRPRDLYDVVNLFRNETERPDPAVLLDVLRQKCEFKSIPLPTLSDLEKHRSDLEGSWDAMLRHQLPALPPVGSFWEVLPAFFTWLNEGLAPVTPAAYVLGGGEEIIRERGLVLRLPDRAQSALEIIRFAAANRLVAIIDYNKIDGGRVTRRIEPYSLRRTQDDNFILHVHDLDRDHHRTYRADRIVTAQITSDLFIPRHEIELTPKGALHVSPTTTRERIRPASRLGSITPPRRSTRANTFGPTYVYECPMCGKTFRRKRRNSRLNPHKDKSGWNCSGRTGYLVDTRY